MDLNLTFGIFGILGTVMGIIMAVYYFIDRHPRFGKLKLKQVISGARQIAENVHNSSFNPEIIVAIHSKGIGFGAIVGEIVAVEENLPLSVISIDISQPQKTPSGATILGIDSTLIKNKRILLVDDICNSGRTLAAARKEIESLQCEVKTAVILAPPEPVVPMTNIDFFVFRSTTGQVFVREVILPKRTKH
jgi:hypoxanthine phosphoribosyltransferase